MKSETLTVLVKIELRGSQILLFHSLKVKKVMFLLLYPACYNGLPTYLNKCSPIVKNTPFRCLFHHQPLLLQLCGHLNCGNNGLNRFFSMLEVVTQVLKSEVQQFSGKCLSHELAWGVVLRVKKSKEILILKITVTV